jgi:outer membrane protein OmpA-like peptidoglycan-associated protein
MARLLLCAAICLSILLVRETRADACGLKLSIKAPRVKRALVASATRTARMPAQTLAIRRPIRVGPARRTPISAGVSASATGDASVAASGSAPSEPTQPVDSADTEPTQEERADRGKRVAAIDTQASSSDREVTAAARVETGNRQASDRFAKRIFFAQATAALNSRARAELTRNAKWLNRHQDRSVVVEGHCSTTGPADANQALSETRAEAVKDFLVEQGVEESRIEAVGFGMTKPEYRPGTSSKNRRVVIRLVNK